ncbi:FMN-linked oxidoreductase [Aspergillus steynii IBT 23096]|uniref:FMN-linked oxidoreductase n=1 Tax=Aspergillus steynii IBT 23096 TaxID=1392250 RepID=A0A2I2GH50_9EURO|nr:FMN-linked oxidoreductase [Aspergillus steynii IBT 23096]PLB52202.1 FMN-linked oxidoreductase [Aspergillus steynii IBT 23096]
MGSTAFQTPAVVKSAATPFFTPANNVGAAVHPDDPKTPTLFRPLQIRDVTVKNRIFVSPMCMYSADNDPSSPAVGAMTDFHIAHLGHFALKGAGLIFVEATAVTANGRISPYDVGLWQGVDSPQFHGLKRVVQLSHSQGAKIGVQLAHAGRKASTSPPWIAAEAGKVALKADEGVRGWPEDIVGPSGGAEQLWNPDGYWTPRALTTEEIKDVVRAFADSAKTAVEAGVDVLEIHAAHGYLIHSFLSPVSNKRSDEYGGSFENRTRLLREVATAIREVIPAGMPLFVRISATEWLEEQPVAAQTGSWDLESSVRLAALLPELGIDLVDVSSAGNHIDQKIHIHTNYQIDLAAHLRKAIRAAGASTLVGAVGFVTEAEQARDIVQEEAQGTQDIVSGPEPRADVVLLARQFLRTPDWVLKTAKALGVEVKVPVQYGRAFR